MGVLWEGAGVRCSSLHLYSFLYFDTQTRVPTKKPFTAFLSSPGKRDESIGLPGRQVPEFVKFSFLLKSQYSSSIKVLTLKLQLLLFQGHGDEAHKEEM